MYYFHDKSFIKNNYMNNSRPNCNTYPVLNDWLFETVYNNCYSQTVVKPFHWLAVWPEMLYSL